MHIVSTISLAEKLRLSPADIHERKMLVGLTTDMEAELRSYRPAIEEAIDDINDTFFARLLNIPRVRRLIGDTDTMGRLRPAMRGYTLDLFSGTYDMAYAEKRLRVGRVHERIGVAPKYVIAAVGVLNRAIGAALEEQTGSSLPPQSLDRLMQFDVSLIFDTYTFGMMNDLEARNEELVAYSHQLEDMVRERTGQIEIAARTDDVTGLLNRRAFMETLDRELAAVRRRSGSLTLCFFDLDGFKQVNDSLGHAAGDAVLRRFAKLIRRTARGSDLAFRFGGDEFCLVLPDTDAVGAEILCQRIAETAAAAPDSPIPFSSGYATAAPGAYTDSQTLIDAADREMYASKGRKAASRQAPETRRKAAR